MITQLYELKDKVMNRYYKGELALIRKDMADLERSFSEMYSDSEIKGENTTRKTAEMIYSENAPLSQMEFLKQKESKLLNKLGAQTNAN